MEVKLAYSACIGPVVPG